MKNYVMLLLLCCLKGLAVRGQEPDSQYPYEKPLFDFDAKKPVFAFTAEQLENPARYLRYYTLSGYREGVTPTLGQFNVTFTGTSDQVSGTRRLSMYNLPLVDMLMHMTGKENTVLLEVKDPSRYRYLPEYGPRELWMRKYARCFEFCLPEGVTEILGAADSVLHMVLGVKITKEKRRVPVLVLSRLSSLEKFKSSEDGTEGFDGKGKFVNVPFEAIEKAMGYTGRYFVNGTGYFKPVDMDMQIPDWKNLKQVNKELKRYDLELREEIQELELKVITETGNVYPSNSK